MVREAAHDEPAVLSQLIHIRWTIDNILSIAEPSEG